MDAPVFEAEEVSITIHYDLDHPFYNATWEQVRDALQERGFGITHVNKWPQKTHATVTVLGHDAGGLIAWLHNQGAFQIVVNRHDGCTPN